MSFRLYVLACFLSNVGFQWIHSTFGQKRAIHLNMSLLLTPGGKIKLGFNGWLIFDQKFFLVLACFLSKVGGFQWMARSRGSLTQGLLKGLFYAFFVGV